MIGCSLIGLLPLLDELAQREVCGDAAAAFVRCLIPEDCCLIDMSSGASDPLIKGVCLLDPENNRMPQMIDVE